MSYTSDMFRLVIFTIVFHLFLAVFYDKRRHTKIVYFVKVPKQMKHTIITEKVIQTLQETSWKLRCTAGDDISLLIPEQRGSVASECSHSVSNNDV